MQVHCVLVSAQGRTEVACAPWESPSRAAQVPSAASCYRLSRCWSQRSRGFPGGEVAPLTEFILPNAAFYFAPRRPRWWSSIPL